MCLGKRRVVHCQQERKGHKCSIFVSFILNLNHLLRHKILIKLNLLAHQTIPKPTYSNFNFIKPQLTLYLNLPNPNPSLHQTLTPFKLTDLFIKRQTNPSTYYILPINKKQRQYESITKQYIKLDFCELTNCCRN